MGASGREDGGFRRHFWSSGLPSNPFMRGGEVEKRGKPDTTAEPNTAIKIENAQAAGPLVRALHVCPQVLFWRVPLQGGMSRECLKALEEAIAEGSEEISRGPLKRRHSGKPCLEVTRASMANAPGVSLRRRACVCRPDHISVRAKRDEPAGTDDSGLSDNRRDVCRSSHHLLHAVFAARFRVRSIVRSLGEHPDEHHLHAG